MHYVHKELITLLQDDSLEVSPEKRFVCMCVFVYLKSFLLSVTASVSTVISLAHYAVQDVATFFTERFDLSQDLFLIQSVSLQTAEFT